VAIRAARRGVTTSATPRDRIRRRALDRDASIAAIAAATRDKTRVRPREGRRRGSRDAAATVGAVEIAGESGEGCDCERGGGRDGDETTTGRARGDGRGRADGESGANGARDGGGAGERAWGG